MRARRCEGGWTNEKCFCFVWEGVELAKEKNNWGLLGVQTHDLPSVTDRQTDRQTKAKLCGPSPQGKSLIKY